LGVSIWLDVVGLVTAVTFLEAAFPGRGRTISRGHAGVWQVVSSRPRHRRPWVTWFCPRELPEEVLSLSSAPASNLGNSTPAKRVLWKWSGCCYRFHSGFSHVAARFRPSAKAKTGRCRDFLARAHAGTHPSNANSEELRSLAPEPASQAKNAGREPIPAGDPG
jgi:hypothetical protein